jgi:hypothetical protein
MTWITILKAIAIIYAFGWPLFWLLFWLWRERD